MTLNYRVFQIPISGKQTAVAVKNGTHCVIVDVGKIVGDTEVIG
jgi:hypothetical protein